VMLPPGRERLATRPTLTGSPVTQTMGTVDVARCAARVICVPGVVSTSTLSARSSALQVIYRVVSRCPIYVVTAGVNPRFFGGTSWQRRRH
jgi:hypothetical protein